MNTDFDFEDIFNESGVNIPEVEPIIEPEVLENPNIRPVANVVTKTMSFNKTQSKIKNDSPQKKFITKEIVIDKFNTKKFKVELTPSVCDICAFDVVATKFGNWHNAPQTEHKNIIKAVEEHKKIVH